ncbi:MAG: class I SAM-dependent methyltransferase [Hyphomicrobiaceae bacterium]
MPSTIDMGLHAGAQALRFGLYYGLSQAMSWQVDRLGLSPRGSKRRVTPQVTEILTELGQLVLRDAAGVREGILPPSISEPGPTETIARIRAMFADLPESARRRADSDAGSVKAEADADAVPDYYAQDFHFQTGGYLSAESARLYDIQVETLFLGGAALMRREALRPIAEFMRGRDQRQIRLLDVACGTGRLLRDLRLAWPAMQLTGLDLSPSYLDEARRHLGDLRPATWTHANAEAIPLADASQDIVTTVFMFHELPPIVRRRIAAEMARVLKPGGLLVFIDSLQIGDRPGWDGLLEGFPERFHEPYYRHYAIDDLDAVFSDAGLAAASRWTSYFAKVMVRTRV